MAAPRFSNLLIRLPSGSATALGLTGAAPLAAAGVAFDLEPLFSVSGPRGPGVAAGEAWEWHLARPKAPVEGAKAWELAHQALANLPALAAVPGVYVEPDLEQEWPTEGSRFEGAPPLGLDGACVFNDQIDKLPKVEGRFAWHLDDDFSELRRARDRVGAPAAGSRIRIVHLDTGFDPTHQSLPAHIALQRNFVDGESPDDARDSNHRGLLKNPGHGAGTLSILAGKEFSFAGSGYSFNDRLGGAPEAEVVPVRVANSVVQVMTSGIAKGLSYANELCKDSATQVHVLSMSMGGVASKAWADAVNQAYENGIVLVTAAGNNFSGGFFGFPTRFIVYPARFRRVIAACGVMANRRPYYGLPFGTMQGNWGPGSKMSTALSAYTPNIAWAEFLCANIVGMKGAGTSSATPQVAAAAALYLQAHAQTLLDRNRYPEPWMRVEAVRQALFQSADKQADGGSSDRLGNGIVRAANALDMSPVEWSALEKSPPDDATLGFLRVLTGVGLQASPQAELLALEATQLAQLWEEKLGPNPFEEAVPDPDLPPEAITSEQKRRFLEAIIDHPWVSSQLKQHATSVRSLLSAPPPPPGPPPPTGPGGPPGGVQPLRPTPTPTTRVVPAPWTSSIPFAPPEPPHRRLRGFAIDPSLSTSLETAAYSTMTLTIPWERLKPGPVGEYLEVIDVDPASDCFYEPVDLEDSRMLAQDGLPPSQGIPQFHQQMVYAVASLTIANFERALGRRVLWRPGPSPYPDRESDDSTFVQRLRIYPHALRQQNAFYLPAKVALLFGYFNELPDPASGMRAGPMVFTCLSHDIIAHETTHALLDGIRRDLLRPSNPDVLAFHEAFADIVALFQHFTFPEILRQQITSTRGRIRSQENFLGQLARQFGQTTGRRGALRDAIGETVNGRWVPHKVDAGEYDRLTEPHERGGLLVAAVFDAFLSIYERRTADLMRLATGGTGVLQPGAIHPDLVGRLSKEAAKAAGHVLTMCIRGLDYMPPTDITFGEYLRAILTADADVVRDDDLNYRIAFLEAFRRRGLQPQDVRTLSVESLLWRTPDADVLQPSQTLEENLQQLRSLGEEHIYAEALPGDGRSRERLFHLQRAARRQLHDWLLDHFRNGREGVRDAAFLGLDFGPGGSQRFEVNSVRFALRASPDGDVVPQLVISLLQRITRPADPADSRGAILTFEGGCAIIADLRSLKIRYAVRKNVSSTGRLSRQQTFASRLRDSSRPSGTPDNPFGLLHTDL